MGEPLREPESRERGNRERGEGTWGVPRGVGAVRSKVLRFTLSPGFSKSSVFGHCPARRTGAIVDCATAGKLCARTSMHPTLVRRELESCLNKEVIRDALARLAERADGRWPGPVCRVALPAVVSGSVLGLRGCWASPRRVHIRCSDSRPSVLVAASLRRTLSPVSRPASPSS
jgi:hypothetical protein